MIDVVSLSANALTGDITYKGKFEERLEELLDVSGATEQGQMMFYDASNSLYEFTSNRFDTAFKHFSKFVHRTPIDRFPRPAIKSFQVCPGVSEHHVPPCIQNPTTM